MTTPKKPAAPKAAAGEADRVKRQAPERGGPRRSASAGPAPQRAAEPPPASDEAAGADSVPVSDAIANAVRRGYQVIGENLEQGRAAAEQFRTGHYSIRDVPYDMNQMALRLLTLTRELSTTACDILEKVLRDPSLAGAAARQAAAQEGQTAPTQARTATPPSFRPAPPPPGASAPSPPGPAAAEKPVRDRTPPAVNLEVRFAGKAAVVHAATFAPPDPPSPIVAPGLLGADAGAPPIRAISFSAGDDPRSMVVTITIAADQPSGVYSGVIWAADTKLPLGALTIEVSG